MSGILKQQRKDIKQKGAVYMDNKYIGKKVVIIPYDKAKTILERIKRMKVIQKKYNIKE